MIESGFVQMLLDVAGGVVEDPRDLELARSAARWVRHAGWQPHLHNSFVVPGENLQRWVLMVRPVRELQIRVRIGNSDWYPHITRTIAHVGHGLDVLADEGLLPARLCPIGRRALDDYAEALDRAASAFWRMAEEATEAELAEYGKHYPWEMRLRSATMNRAADQARAFRGELAVLP